MVVSPRQVLVVTRDGTLSGDQLFLLYFLRWLTGATTTRAEVLTWHDGPLTADLREIVRVRAIDELDRWRPARFLEILRIRRAAQVLKSLRLRWWLYRRRHTEVLYVNGLEAARIIGFLPKAHPPVVVHIHDLAELSGPGLSTTDRELIAGGTDRFIAASDEVAEQLRDELEIDEGRIVRHDHFVAGADHLPASTEPPGRQQLGIGPDDIVIGGIGTADWWAAADQFVLMAWALRRARPELRLRFLWIAGDDDPKKLWPLRHDLANAGVEDLTVLGTGRRPLDYVAVMDVLVLATRVESQELIALEAAASDVVVVATDNLTRTGAVRDLALIVPFLDITALVDGILSVVEDPDQQRRHVDRARAVAHGHHDVTVGGPALLELLEVDP